MFARRPGPPPALPTLALERDMLAAAQHRAALEVLRVRHGVSAADFAAFIADVEKLIDELVLSDALAKASIDHARGDKHVVPPAGGVIQLGFVLYWLKYSKDLEPYLDKLPPFLREVWKLSVAVLLAAHPPTVTPEDYAYLEGTIHQQGVVAPDGEILGTGKYAGADEGWLWAFFNYLINLSPVGQVVAPFHPGSGAPFEGQLEGDGDVKIAIIGDWGTGPYHEGGDYDPALDVLATVERLKPDYLIHLGDVYYSGTEERYPQHEESAHLVQTWPTSLPARRSFTLNSNHEMYGGAFGYFDVALGRAAAKPTPFQHQNGYSYFALTRGDWAFVGIDAAYFDPSTLYMVGGLGDAAQDPQYAFLKDIAARFKNVVLFSHQTAMSTDGTSPLQLWHDVTSVVPPAQIKYWYWGHIHLGLVYGARSALGSLGVKARCAGHSAIPIGAPWGLCAGADQPIEWLAQEKLTKTPYANRVRNGFALLTVGANGVAEAFYDAGSITPAWPTVHGSHGAAE